MRSMPSARRHSIAPFFGVIALASCAMDKPRPSAPQPGIVVASVRQEPWKWRVPDSETHLRRLSTGEEVVRRTNGCGYAEFDGLADDIYSIRSIHEGVAAEVPRVLVSSGKVSIVLVDLPQRATEHGNGTPTSPQCTPPRFLSGPSPTNYVDGRFINGCLVVKCVITTSGSVGRCHAIEPLEGLTKHVITTLEKRLYTPWLCDGKPQELDYTFTLDFRSVE